MTGEIHLWVAFAFVTSNVDIIIPHTPQNTACSYSLTICRYGTEMLKLDLVEVRVPHHTHVGDVHRTKITLE